MNTNYTNVVKKIILQKPVDRDLFFNKRKKRLQYIFESCELISSNIPTIHVVGTKGKGSTSTFLANILKEATHTTGLFTSPHLHKIPERIKINLEDISENSFTSAFNTFVTKINDEKLAGFGGNSFFETLMILALIHFKNKNVSFQIFEAGIGGTHDSTNFIPNKIATLITNISLDHQNILGNTLEEIATDKAGAISENSITISAPQKNSVNKIISEINTSKQSELKKPFQRSFNLMPVNQSKNILRLFQPGSFVKLDNHPNDLPPFQLISCKGGKCLVRQQTWGNYVHWEVEHHRLKSA